MAVYALSMSWKALWANAYPPPTLLPRVLEKAQQDQCELILIAPHWQSRSVQSPVTRVESIWDTLCSRDVLVNVASCVSRHQRESTLAIYESKWRIFTAWCNIQHINPFSTTESVVSDFLLHFHMEKHLAISTIAHYQMQWGSRMESCIEVTTSKYRNGTGATSTSLSRVESGLSFVSIDKTTYRISCLHGRLFSSSRLLPTNIRAKSMPLNMPDYNGPQAGHRWLYK